MSEFKAPPQMLLHTMNDVFDILPYLNKACKAARAANQYGWKFRGIDPWLIKSVWIIGLIDEIVATGEFPYNAMVKKRVLDDLGFPARTDKEDATEGDGTSLLVYNAQCYRTSDQWRFKGFEPYVNETLVNAGIGGKIMAADEETVCTVKIRNDKAYAMYPRSKSKYLSMYGQPVKIVKVGKWMDRRYAYVDPVIVDQALLNAPAEVT